MTLSAGMPALCPHASSLPYNRKAHCTYNYPNRGSLSHSCAYPDIGHHDHHCFCGHEWNCGEDCPSQAHQQPAPKVDLSHLSEIHVGHHPRDGVVLYCERISEPAWRVPVTERMTLPDVIAAAEAHVADHIGTEGWAADGH